jgi:hypothetical protein
MGGKMMKRLVLIMIAILLPLSFAYAGGGGESAGKSGYSLYYLPSNVVNNQNILVELTQAKSVNAGSLGSSFGDAISRSYGNDNLVFCCIMDTLKKSIQNGNNVNLTITSPDASGFYFVKDGNETVKVPFEIEVCLAMFYKGDNSATYPVRTIQEKLMTGTTRKFSYETHRRIADFFIFVFNDRDDPHTYNGETSFTKTGSNLYTLSIAPSEFTNTMNNNTRENRYETNEEYPNIVAYYYLCLKILPNQNLEEGPYTATFSLNSTFNSQDISGNTKNNDSINEAVTIKGYVGEEPETSGSEYSFFLSPSVNTYFMDLAVEKDGDEPTYDVARVQFSNTQVVTNPNNPASTNQRRAYTVYISPTNSYGVSDDYEFIRTGTERQERVFANTVEFDLLLQTSDGVYEYIRNSQDYTGNGNNAKANAEAHFKKGKIGGAGLYNGTTNTFFLYPVYSSQQTSSGANNKWKETWELDQHIYLRVKEDSKEISEGANSRKHQEGMYKTTIYFTVVSP